MVAKKPLVVVLCPDGDQLNQAWSALLGKGCLPDEIYQAAKAYYAHRAKCPLCKIEIFRERKVG